MTYSKSQTEKWWSCSCPWGISSQTYIPALFLHLINKIQSQTLACLKKVSKSFLIIPQGSMVLCDIWTQLIFRNPIMVKNVPGSCTVFITHISFNLQEEDIEYYDSKADTEYVSIFQLYCFCVTQ